MKASSITCSVALVLAILLHPLEIFAMTGNDWNTHEEAVKASYVMGVIEGWREAATVEKEIRDKGSTMAWLVGCLSVGMSYKQILAIVEKYMKEHPEEWHLEMSTLVFSGIAQMCTQRNKN